VINVRPFHGFIYNREENQDLSLVIAPPYDVISQEERRQLLSKSPYNIVQLTLGEDNQDNPDEEFYTQAKRKWNRWCENQIFIRVKKPAIWKVDESFMSPSNQYLTRTGFIALIRLENYSINGIQRHERTLDKPKLDRFKLIESTRTNFSPIFFIYLDKLNQERTLNQNYEPEDGSHATMNQDGSKKIDISYTTDRDWIQQFCSVLNQSIVLIADGHHRYEASLSLHKKNSGVSFMDTSYTMGYFVSSFSEGLGLNPTHRGIYGLSVPDYEGKIDKLWNYFEKKTSLPTPSFQFIHNGHDPIPLQLKPEMYNNLKKSIKPFSLTAQGVVVFEEIVLKGIFGLSSSEIANWKHLRYYHDTEIYLNDLKKGNLQMIFLFDPIPIEDLFAIAAEGGILPQKSTFFYPKCPSGLVMHSLEKP